MHPKSFLSDFFWGALVFLIRLHDLCTVGVHLCPSENSVASKYSGGCGAAILGLTACGASDGCETCGQKCSTYQIGFGDAEQEAVSVKFCISEAVLVREDACPRVSLPDGRSTMNVSIVQQLRSRILGFNAEGTRW